MGTDNWKLALFHDLALNFLTYSALIVSFQHLYKDTVAKKPESIEILSKPYYCLSVCYHLSNDSAAYRVWWKSATHALYCTTCNWSK